MWELTSGLLSLSWEKIENLIFKNFICFSGFVRIGKRDQLFSRKEQWFFLMWMVVKAVSAVEKEGLLNQYGQFRSTVGNIKLLYSFTKIKPSIVCFSFAPTLRIVKSLLKVWFKFQFNLFPLQLKWMLISGGRSLFFMSSTALRRKKGICLVVPV